MVQKYTKDFIKSSLNTFIKHIGVNDWLLNCKSMWSVNSGFPTNPPNFEIKTCYEEFNKMWSKTDTSSIWVLSIKSIDEPQINSYISFSIFNDEVDGIRDNAIYIIKSCTDISKRELGLSKLLHWLVIQFGLYLGNIDYIAAYVIDKTENYILLSLGSMSLVNIYNSLVIDEEYGKEIKSEIFKRHNIRANSMIILDTPHKSWDIIKNQIIRCQRPK